MPHILISLFLCALSFGDIFMFTPPESWVAAPSRTKNPYHLVTFVSPDISFPPSLSVAKEPLTVDKSAFLQAVEHHLKESSPEFIRLGKIDGKVPYSLYQITKKTNHGSFTLLTAVLFHEKIAYTVSFAAKTDVFPQESRAFRKVLQTIRFPKDIDSIAPTGYKQLVEKARETMRTFSEEKKSSVEKAFSTYENDIKALVPKNETYLQFVLLQNAFKKT